MADTIKLGKAQIQGERNEQQDAYGCNYEEEAGIVPRGGVVAVVADGVGGHSHGKAASELAVRSFLHAYRSGVKQKTVADALFYALHAANNAVCKFAQAQGAEGDCGTTLTAAAVQPGALSLHWISTGDSRLYLLRGKQWVQVTADGNYGAFLRKQAVKDVVAEADESAEEDGAQVELMALTGFLGKPKLTEIDRSLRPFALEPEDWLLLCTDGLYNTLEGGEVVDCLRGWPQDACDALVRSVMAKGLMAQDNATVAILAFQSRDLPAKVDFPKPQAKPPERRPPEPARPPASKRLLWIVLAGLAVLAGAGLAYHLVGTKIWSRHGTGLREENPAEVMGPPRPTSMP